MNTMSNNRLFAFLCAIILFSSCREEELKLADASIVWWMAPAIIANKDSCYIKNNVSVTSFDVQTGLASKNAVVAGTADIGLVATTPLVRSAIEKEGLIILCSFLQSNSLLAVIAPSHSTSDSIVKPVPPVAIVDGTISEVYYYRYLSKFLSDTLFDAYRRVSVKPTDIVNALKSDAKSACIWEPFASFAEESYPNLKISRPTNIYQQRMYVVTTPACLKRKRKQLENYVASLKMACEKINSNPEKSKDIIASIFPKQRKSMDKLWQNVQFSIEYDYENMKELLFEEYMTSGKLKKEMNGNPSLTKNDFSYFFNHNFAPKR